MDVGDEHGSARELVAECLERFEQGGLAAVEAHLAAHPEHAEAARERLRALLEAGLLDAPPEGAAFPERLGPFRLVKRLGGGGMGVVYLAVQEPLGREVALKLVRPDLLYFDRARERFRREVEVVARLKHPGIVPVYTVGEEQGIPFYAMEHVEGRSLDDVLRALRGRDPAALAGRDLLEIVGGVQSAAPLASVTWVDACLRVVLEIAGALEHAHAQGVLHRDLKPSNVMLTPGARARLVDFGLASTRGTTPLTRTGSHVGSLPYMAPEQLRGEPVDERTDLYALGVTLYELLTLRLPYLARDPEGTRRAILAAAPRPPRDRNPSVSWEAETVCLTAMEPDPARRYTSARALADDLRAVLDRRPIAARRPGPALRSLRFVQRRPALALGIAAGVLLLASSLAFALVQHQASRALARAVGEKDAALADARAGFRRALAATNEMLRDVGRSELTRVPASERLQRELLADAARLYEELLAERPADAELLREAALGFLARAHLQRQMGDLSGAGESIERSFELLEPSVAEHPLDPAVLAPLAAAFEESLARLGLAGRSAEALEAGRRAVAIRRELLATARHRGAPDAERDRAETDLGVALGELGGMLLTQRDFERAEAALGEACALLASVARRDPASDRARRYLAYHTEHLGGVLQESGRLDEAERVLDEALALADELERSTDLSAERDACARIRFRLATLLHRRGRPEEALEHAEDAAARYARVASEYPDLLDPAAFRVWTLARAASILLGLGRVDEADARLDEALALAEGLLERHPDVPRAHEVFVDCVTSLGRQRLESGRAEEAEEVLRWALEEVERLCAAWPASCEEGSFRSHATTALARARLALGRFEDARALCDEARDAARARRDGSPERERALVSALSLRAEVAAAEGDRAAVLGSVRELGEIEADAPALRRAAGIVLAEAEPGEEAVTLALELLDRCRRGENAVSPDELASAADLRVLRGDPRFERLLAPEVARGD